MIWPERLIDADGEPCVVSHVRATARVPMDDPALQHARRTLLAGRPFDAVATLLHDDAHFAASILVARGAQVARLDEDPFARLFVAERIDVPAGVLGRTPWPAGPVIERYGSDNPWPWDRFG